MLNSSKLFKGLGSILIASSLAVSPVIVSENIANADSTQSSANQEDYKINQNIANIIYNNLEKNDKGELQIIDKEYLKNELSDSGLDITVKDVENYIEQYNKTMQGKNGEKAMAALGVSGPVGWGVGAGMGALYAGGSIACNHA